ncbi:MAG: cytochrome b [Alphaproteobacteria bacterium]
MIDKPQGYSKCARFLHWLMAVWMIVMLAVGFYMVDLPSGPLRFGTFYPIHKISGFFFLFFVIFRLFWRSTHPAPPLPKMHPIHRFFAKASIPVLYAIMFIMPISGFVMSHASGHPIAFGSFGTLPAMLPQNPQLANWASEIHRILPFAIIFILAMHILAALYHHFILKDTVLRRMIRGGT